MAVAVLFISCESKHNDSVATKHLYKIEKLKSLHEGDTMYVQVCGELLRAVVINNDTEIQIITIKRSNLFDSRHDDFWLEEIKTYDQINGN